MTLDATLGASDALTSNAPEKAFTFVAVRRTGGRPWLKVVRSSAADWVNQGLKGLLVDVRFLKYTFMSDKSIVSQTRTSSSSFNEARGIADVSPALRLLAAIVCQKITVIKLQNFVYKTARFSVFQ